MRKILLLSLVFVTNFSFAQATYETTGNASNWDSASTWTLVSGSAADSDSNGVPDSNDNVEIKHNITVDSNNACNNLTTFAPSFITKTITVNNASTLTVAGNVVNDGGIILGSGGTIGTMSITGNVDNDNSITINEGSIMTLSSTSNILAEGSMVINSSSSTFGSLVMPGGAFTPDAGGWSFEYGRYVNSVAGGWDLISAPVSGLTISSFVDTNSDVATNGSSPTQYAVGVYTNTAAASAAGNEWQNYTSSSVGSTEFEDSKGYQMATTGGSKVEFRGVPHTGTQTIDIVYSETGVGPDNVASDGSRFNLVGNPYPSYITVTDFINTNTSSLGGAGHQAVQGWTGSGYTTKNLASGGYIAPGQGFMVAAVGPSVGDTATITFNVGMMTSSASGANDFVSSMMNDNRSELFLSFNQNQIEKSTEIYFLDNVTDLLDSGYDAYVFGLEDAKIYTRLVQDDEGVNLAIQSLAYSEMWDKVIPLGLNALGGEEMTVSISHRTTPADLNIYLEDTEEGTMTNLLEEDFVLTPAADLGGVGRFFIHMTADTMSNEDISTSMLNAYKAANANYITIEGLATQSNNINVSLFNILGRKVLNTSLSNSMNTQTISTVGMASGIYVIELESGTDRLTKKLIIQ